MPGYMCGSHCSFKPLLELSALFDRHQGSVRTGEGESTSGDTSFLGVSSILHPLHYTHAIC